MDRAESSAHRATLPDVSEAIRLDVAAAEEIAAVEYRREIRRMMRAGTLDPEPEEEL